MYKRHYFAQQKKEMSTITGQTPSADDHIWLEAPQELLNGP